MAKEEKVGQAISSCLIDNRGSGHKGFGLRQIKLPRGINFVRGAITGYSVTRGLKAVAT